MQIPKPLVIEPAPFPSHVNVVFRTKIQRQNAFSGGFAYEVKIASTVEKGGVALVDHTCFFRTFTLLRLCLARQHPQEWK